MYTPLGSDFTQYLLSPELDVSLTWFDWNPPHLADPTWILCQRIGVQSSTWLSRSYDQSDICESVWSNWSGRFHGVWLVFGFGGGAGWVVSSCSCVKSSWEGGRSQTLPDQWMWFWRMLGLEHLWRCTYQDLALPLQRDEQDGKKASFQSKEERVLKHVISWVPNKALFVWFWSPNLMDFLMARLLKHQPNQINHSRLNFFSAARCTPCFWCNMISRCGLCLWTRHPHVGIRWEVILGFPGSFFYAWHPSKEAGFAKWYDRAEMALECGVLDCDWESTLSSST